MNLLNIKFVTIIILLLLNISIPVAKHPLHVSTTEVNFNAKDKTLEVTCKIFTDDFEDILSKNYKQKTDLSKPALKSTMDNLVKKYLLSHLKITVDQKNATLNYIGFEIDHEVTNIYMEIENIKTVKKVDVDNRILYDLFDDQISINHVIKGADRKSGKLLYPDTKFSASF
ncbi:hypothetical protein EZJ43_03545 [Pedobacter changchengzhani]|uniref:Peptidase E n=1 Tax=Pedobacter changchengzhani TaxID=2529274 RepID=A0A4R5MNP3_9SPHI|nr:DUF6702 family protein [Pedobacter changchengzhani]TDG37206.1 hypothetical protein EZJ43_03545 [Pedobacter changchengzhani]